MPFIYLDYNATTPLDPRVAEAMQPFLTGGFGNPSSSHAEGRKAKSALEGAREQVARCLGCRTSEIVFTSGGSESNNLALRGLVEARGGGHVITSAVEHPAVLQPLLALEMDGRISLTVVGVDGRGRVSPSVVEAALREDTILVSLMLANNEVGTLQPVREVAELCRDRGVSVHTDAAQAVGKVPVDVGELGVDLLSVAGHKLYAPKGIGALFIRDGVALEPQIRGAGHEHGLRAGTENVLLTVGLGTACELVGNDLSTVGSGFSEHRDALESGLREHWPDLVVHGHPDQRLPNTSSVALRGLEADELLEQLGERLAASAGAACHAGAATVSHVLQAMAVDPDLARGTIRFSVGRFTTSEDIEAAVSIMAGIQV